MAETEPVEITDHIRRGGRRHPRGWLQWSGVGLLVGFLSLVFILMGVGRQRLMPPALAWTLGAIPLLILAGAILQYRLRVRQMERIRREYPGEWWREDYLDYDVTGSTDSRGERFRQQFAGFFGTFLLLSAGFGTALSFSGWFGGIVSLSILVLTGLLVLGLWIGISRQMFLLIGQKLKYKAGRVEFERFPFFPGEMLDVTLIWDEACEAITLCCRLECIEERWVRVRTGRRSSEAQHRYYRLAQVVQTVIVEEGLIRRKLPDGKEHRVLPIRISIPRQIRSTHLQAEESAVCWLLDITGDAPGIDFHLRVPVPIYTRNRPKIGKSAARQKSSKRRRK